MTVIFFSIDVVLFLPRPLVTSMSFSVTRRIPQIPFFASFRGPNETLAVGACRRPEFFVPTIAKAGKAQRRSPRV